MGGKTSPGREIKAQRSKRRDQSAEIKDQRSRIKDQKSERGQCNAKTKACCQEQEQEQEEAQPRPSGAPESQPEQSRSKAPSLGCGRARRIESVTAAPVHCREEGYGRP